MKQLIFINPHSVARVGATLSFLFTGLTETPLLILQLGRSFLSGSPIMAWWPILSVYFGFLIVIPLFTYCALLLGARFYNWIAKRFGGIEVDVC